MPIALTGIEQFVTTSLLGVLVGRNLNLDARLIVSNIMSIFGQRRYLLKCIKGQRLPAKQLNTVFCALVISRILYALTAWASFPTAV